MAGSKYIQDNVEYIIDLFSEYGIILDENKNFYMDNGDYAITLFHNGCDFLISYNEDTRKYEVRHLNKGCNKKGKTRYHLETTNYSMIPIANYISIVHKDFKSRWKFKSIKNGK